MITLMQTEKTYEVILNENDYTVTVIFDPTINQTQYDVFDSEGFEVHGKEELEVVSYLENQID